MRAFVERKGFSLATATGKKKLKTYLLTNLARMQQELLQAREHVQPDANRVFSATRDLAR